MTEEINPYFLTSSLNQKTNAITIIADITKVGLHQKTQILRNAYEKLTDSQTDNKTVPAFIYVNVYPFKKLPRNEKIHFKSIEDYTQKIFETLHEYRLAFSDKENAIITKKALIDLFNDINKTIDSNSFHLTSSNIGTISLNDIVDYIAYGKINKKG